MERITGIDHYSYQCGIIECFNEMVRAGVKQIALSHPVASQEELRRYLPFAEEICKEYGTQYYWEEDAFLTDLFPVSMNRGKYNLIFYQDRRYLDAYLELKERKKSMVREGRYCGEERRQLAVDYGKLLSYREENIAEMIRNNPEKE